MKNDSNNSCRVSNTLPRHSTPLELVSYHISCHLPRHLLKAPTHTLPRFSCLLFSLTGSMDSNHPRGTSSSRPSSASIANRLNHSDEELPSEQPSSVPEMGHSDGTHSGQTISNPQGIISPIGTDNRAPFHEFVQSIVHHPCFPLVSRTSVRILQAAEPVTADQLRNQQIEARIGQVGVRATCGEHDLVDVLMCGLLAALNTSIVSPPSPVSPNLPQAGPSDISHFVSHGTQAKSGVFTPKKVAYLKKWFQENIAKPYPTLAQMEHFADRLNLSVKQVQDWFGVFFIYFLNLSITNTFHIYS